MKQKSGFLKKEKLERFIGLRRVRDKNSLFSVLAPPMPAMPDSPLLTYQGKLSIAGSLSKILKSSPLSSNNVSPLSSNTAIKATPAKTIPTKKSWTSLQDVKGIESFMGDRPALIAMAREEMYELLC
jgi:hypothetical protein